MTRPKSTTRMAPINTTFSDVVSGDVPPLNRIRHILLAALIGVYVATPLIPSEAAADFGSGLPLVMLLWLIALTWLVQGLLRGTLEARFEPVGTAFLFLVCWLAISVIVMAKNGAARPAINMLWEWIAYVIGFRMCLQLIRSAVEVRAVCAVMISLAVALASYGIYQFSVSLPDQRTSYFDASAEERAQIRRDAGVYATEGSPQVVHFEQRLKSVEPWATFGLTNSLAAFLVPWLVVTLGIVAHTSYRHDLPTWKLVTTCILLALMGSCLLLTKSRAGILAALTGSALIMVLQWRVLHTKFGRLSIVAIGILSLVTGIAIRSGGLDVEMLSEAPKSLQYRIEYWQATWQLITNHLWFGCGLGNFQEYYLQYKLPQASEEIKDPHNFFLEVWANGGTPAMLALTTMLILFFWSTCRSLNATSNDDDEQQPGNDLYKSSQQPIRWIYGGGALGLVFSFPLSVLVGFTLPLECFVVTIVPATLCLWLLHRWVCHGGLAPGTTIVAICVAFLTLAFTGGIGFPGVVGSIWLLMAISMCSSPGTLTLHVLGQWRLIVSVLLIIALCLACYLTAYQPVLTGKDPWNSDFWNQLATQHFERWLSQEDNRDFSEFQHSVEMILKYNAHSPYALRQAGLWYLLAGIKADTPAHLEKAERFLLDATQLYPTSSALQADYAWSLHLLGRSEEAAEAATTALRLDRLNPHKELKLKQRRLFDEPPSGNFPTLQITPDNQSAEQCMVVLRKNSN